MEGVAIACTAALQAPDEVRLRWQAHRAPRDAARPRRLRAIPSRQGGGLVAGSGPFAAAQITRGHRRCSS